MPRKAAKGNGHIRQRSDGRWEGKYTVGRDPGTGKQIQKSVYGKTQAEVRIKLRDITHSIDTGEYMEPAKMTVGEWLDVWFGEYANNLKEHTRATYETQIRCHIKPALGAVKLSVLKPHQIQKFYNKLLADGLKPKTIKNINGVFHRALDQAVMLQYIAKNPCFGVKLPRIEDPEMHPLTEDEMHRFFEAIKGNPYEMIFKVDVFSGMRQAEIMGLTWDRVDFEAGTILIDRQLIHEKKKGGAYKFAPLKNDKPRKITPAASVMRLLKEQKRIQAQNKLLAGSMWDDGGFPGLVFTNPLGGHYVHNTLTHNVTRLACVAGIESFCFHDLRHTYAVNALRAGDDVKTVQYNLGHATAAFTLDKYAHYTEDMRQDSAKRMDDFMSRFPGL